jgi:hypothetical protein
MKKVNEQYEQNENQHENEHHHHQQQHEAQQSQQSQQSQQPIPSSTPSISSKQEKQLQKQNEKRADWLLKQDEIKAQMSKNIPTQSTSDIKPTRIIHHRDTNEWLAENELIDGCIITSVPDISETGMKVQVNI